MTISDEEQLRAAIGPRSEYYLRQFEQFEHAGDQWVATWNWPAFFFSSGWFAYRRMGSLSLLNFFLPIAIIFLLMVLFGGESWGLTLAVFGALAFGILPMYANQLYYRHLKRLRGRAASSPGNRNVDKLLSPPSFTTGLEAFFTAVLTPVIPAFLIVAPPMYADYNQRFRVSESIARAYSVRESVAEFYKSNNRLPAVDEAGNLRIDGGKHTHSIVYDAGKRMIVITMGERFEHRRFAMHAGEKGGKLSWTCRTIDLEEKYLPPACRD